VPSDNIHPVADLEGVRESAVDHRVTDQTVERDDAAVANVFGGPQELAVHTVPRG
jgi:hypothetical protein